MAAVPSIGRANRVEGVTPLEADLTRSLYEQHANAIFRYCLHQLGSREEAEDAVQSTFLNAFRGIKRGVVPELESAWLFKIAHNVCLSRRRSSWRRGRVESPADFELVEEIAPAPSRRADELIGLQDALEQMPETQRRAILLREWQGLSYREIAEELELSQAAVETLIFRARRALASGLEQPPAARRRSIARAADWGNLVTALKSLLVGGSAAAKIAATVAVVSATTVVAAEPVQQHRAHRHAATPTRSISQSQRSAATSAPAASGSAPMASGTPFTRVVRHRLARVERHKQAMALVTRPQAPVPVDDSGAAALTPAPSAQQPAPEPAPPAPAAPVPGAPAPVQPAPAAADKPKNGNQGSGGNGNGHGRFTVAPVQPTPVDPVTPQPEPATSDSGSKGNSWRKQQGGPVDPVQPAPTPVAPTPSVTVTPTATATPSTVSEPLTVAGAQPTAVNDGTAQGS